MGRAWPSATQVVPAGSTTGKTVELAPMRRRLRLALNGAPPRTQLTTSAWTEGGVMPAVGKPPPAEDRAVDMELLEKGATA